MTNSPNKYFHPPPGALHFSRGIRVRARRRKSLGARKGSGMRVSRSLMVLAFMACTGIAEADGSIGFEEIDAVLRQRPELRTYLVDTLCISNSGLASRVAGEYPMGGSRLGPYELDAKPKGQAGPYV